MRKSIQQTEKWCAEHDVELSFPRRDGINYVRLSKGEPCIEVEYNQNGEDNGKVTLGEVVDRMERWLHGGEDIRSDLH